MTHELVLLIVLVVVLAAFMVVHFAVLFRALAAKNMRLGVRLTALVPPVAPVIAWLGGARALPVIWAVLLAGYVALRAIG